MVATLLLVGGVAALVFGGGALVDGASAIARRHGVPPLVVGLTIVAFGTSLPELAVSVSAALGGSPGIAFGNVVGSNIANIGLVAGLAALVRPVEVHATVVRRELPVVLGLTLLAIGLVQFDPEATFGRVDAGVLLGCFGVALWQTLRSARAEAEPAPESTEAARRPGLRLAVGLVLVLVGAELTVRGAVSLAESMGVSRTLVGLTVVAVGTSLPELVTSLVAAVKGESDLALGNVLGSNVFNITAILGTTALVRPIPVPTGGASDLWVALGFSALLLPLARTGWRLVRWEGGMLLAAYAGYVTWRATLG